VAESDDDSEKGLSMDGDSFVALKNAEGQYSLWPAGHAVPEGWSVEGGPASKAECAALIESRWTDMRPESLRRLMEHGPKRG
jgi:MbtH protein